MSALLSPCGTYRYLLTRDHPQQALAASRATVVFVMLNPSTADATVDDPTIRRCIGFAERWDCAGLVVANLYALRATNPKALRAHADPVGPGNDNTLRDVAARAGNVVCAWGVHAQPERVRQVVGVLMEAGAGLWCLGTTKDGHPRHPLYVPGNTKLQRWIAP